jgi:hypothetical protein
MRTKGEACTLFVRRSAVDRMCAITFGAAGDARHSAASYDVTAITPLADVKGEFWHPGRWRAVKVKVRGDAGECWLDDVKLFDFKAGGHAVGSVGLKTAGSAYRFRNIKVTAPSGAILLEGLPDLPSP